MNDYKNFAYYFDEILSQVDYMEWVDFTKNYIKNTDRILDLACGTGTFAICLKNFGFSNVTGLDLSSQMIDIAKEKSKMNHMLIDYYVADMTSFDLNTKFDVITCYFDSINHLSSLEDVKKTVDQVYDHLDEKGLFLFDIFSKHQYNKSEGLIEDVTPSCNYTWKILTSEPNVLEHNITICDESNIINEKYNEYYYDLKDIIDDRFNVIKISGDFEEDYDEESGRLIVVLEKK